MGCISNDFKFAITTDNYPSETLWTLVNQCSGEVQAQGGPYSSAATQYDQEECIPDGEYTFTITDSYGDGICCGYGSGSYTVEYNGSVIKQGGTFGSSESTTFGSCDGPSTAAPTSAPTSAPTAAPTNAPTAAPTSAPTSAPTPAPTNAPTDATDPPISDPPVTSPFASPVAPPVAAPTGDNWDLIYEDDFEAGQGRWMGSNKRSGKISYPDGAWSLRTKNPSA